MVLSATVRGNSLKTVLAVVTTSASTRATRGTPFEQRQADSSERRCGLSELLSYAARKLNLCDTEYSETYFIFLSLLGIVPEQVWIVGVKGRIC